MTPVKFKFCALFQHLLRDFLELLGVFIVKNKDQILMPSGMKINNNEAMKLRHSVIGLQNPKTWQNICLCGHSSSIKFRDLMHFCQGI